MSIENTLRLAAEDNTLSPQCVVALAILSSFVPGTLQDTMALHVPLVNFLSRLNTDVGAGTEKEFLTTTGGRANPRP